HRPARAVHQSAAGKTPPPRSVAPPGPVLGHPDRDLDLVGRRLASAGHGRASFSATAPGGHAGVRHHRPHRPVPETLSQTFAGGVEPSWILSPSAHFADGAGAVYLVGRSSTAGLGP